MPPKDFQKWAEICEHIIRHYNEGWADGFEWNIEYWEIWNEPDLDADDSPNKRNWGGTKVQFFDLFEVAAKQNHNVDMLMYYDARPGQMNGMFNYYDYAPMKGYYPFKMFNTLYRMGTSIDCDIDGENVYVTAAKDKDGNSSAMICYYAEDDEAGDKKDATRLSFENGCHIDMCSGGYMKHLRELMEEHFGKPCIG